MTDTADHLRADLRQERKPERAPPEVALSADFHTRQMEASRPMLTGSKISCVSRQVVSSWQPAARRGGRSTLDPRGDLGG